MTEQNAEIDHEYPCDDLWCRPCHALAHATAGPFDPIVLPRAEHDCAECADCIHDGHKCCGCYDGNCCQEADDA